MKIKVAVLSFLLLTGCHAVMVSAPESENPSTTVQENISMPDMQNIYMTKAYETAATRVTNKMLDDSADLYEIQPKPKLYIKQIVKTAPELPDGFYTAQRAVKDIVKGSGTFVVVDKMEDATYILETSVNQFNVANLPGIIMKQSLNNTADQPLRAWNIVIKQMAEDQSWQ